MSMQKYKWEIVELVEKLLFIALGLWLIIRQDLALVIISGLMSLVMFISGAVGMVKYLFKRGAHRPENAYQPAIMLLFGAIWMSNRAAMADFVPLLIGLWAMLMGVAKLMICTQYKRANERSWFVSGIVGLVYILFGYLNICDLMRGLGISALVIGLYMIAYGVFELTEALLERYLKKDVTLIQLRGRGMRVGLPVFLGALLPSRILHDIRRQTKDKSAEEVKQLSEEYGTRKALSAQDIQGGQPESNAEIFVHLSDEALSTFGHVDIAIDDTVISYGNYDSSANRLFGACSDGVIAVIPREPYIEFALNNEHKILMGFQLNLTQDMIEAMLAKLQENAPATVEWKSPYQVWRDTGRIGEKPEDLTSKLADDTGAHFYRIVAGKYRYFFGLNTNCVHFVDDMIGVIGLDKMRFSGTLTPGEYFTFLESQLGANGKYQHLVVERKTYIVPEASDTAPKPTSKLTSFLTSKLGGANGNTPNSNTKSTQV